LNRLTLCHTIYKNTVKRYRVTFNSDKLTTYIFTELLIMPLDLSALRNKLSQLKGGADRTQILWKPQEGENTIRILPLATNPDNPFVELYFHYLGGKTYLSPMSFGEPDPIAEFSENLISGGGLTKDEYREAKKFSPQIRTFVPVIDRKSPDQGVRFWAFGKTVYQELLSVMADPDFGDITDQQTGRDIKVLFTPQEKSDTGFAKTAVRVSPKQTALTTDASQLKLWLTEQPDLMALYKKLSYDELKDVLDRFVNGGKTDSPTVRKVTQVTEEGWGDDVEEVTPTKARSIKKAAADVEEEFANLFNN